MGLDLWRGALALMEEGMGLIHDPDYQRPTWGGTEVPRVGHTQDPSDGPLAVDHQPVDSPEHVAHLVQVVLGVQPGSWVEPVVVGAALAVDEHELDGR